MQDINELFARVELTEEMLAPVRRYDGTCGYMNVLTEIQDSDNTIGLIFSSMNYRMELTIVVKPTENAPTKVFVTTLSGDLLESIPSHWADGAFIVPLQNIDQLVGAEFKAA